MIRAIVLMLTLGLLGACGHPEDCPPACLPLPTASGFMLPCDPVMGCPGSEEDPPPPPPSSVRIDIAYENRTSSPITTYATLVAQRVALDPSGWQETRVNAPNTGTFIPGVLTGEVGRQIRFSITDMVSGFPALVTTITPQTARVYCHAILLGGGAIGATCTDG